MVSKSGSGKKSGSTCTGDAGSEDLLVAELKKRVAVLENELRLKHDSNSPDITERKRTEEALRKSEEKYRELVENANSIIIRWDKQGNLTFFNEYAENLFGYSEDEILGRNVVGTIVPLSESTGRDLAATMEDIERYPERYKSHVNENLCKNGERVWIAWTNKAIRDEHGNVIEILSVGNDITERKRVEEELASAHALINTLLEQAPIGFTYLDRELRYVLINEKLAEMNGIPAADHIGKHVQDTVPKLAPMIQKIADQMLETGLPVKDVEFSGDTSAMPGVKRYWNVSWYPVHDKGTIVGFGAVAEEVTERKLTEQALQSERLQLLSIFDSIDEVIYVADPYTHEILYANRAMQDKFGKSLTGGICYREIQGKDAPCEFCTNGIILSKKVEPYRWEFHNPTVNRDFDIVDRIIQWPDGRDVRFEIALDITERKRANEALRESEEKFRVLAETSPAAIFLYQGEKYVYVNPMAETLTGYSKDELLTGDAWEWIHPDFLELVKGRARKRQLGEKLPCQYEVKYRAKDGRKGWVDFAAGQIEYQGKPAGLAAAFDVTKRKQAEKALIRERYILTKSQEVAHLGNWAWNVETGELTGSDENYRIYGYEPGEVKPTPEWVLSRVHPEDRTAAADFIVARATDGKWGSMDFRIIRPNGSVVYVNSIVDKAVRDKTGKVTRLYGITQDITKRKKAEDELKAAKLQAELYVDLMGHDINNMHQVALGYLELARDLSTGADQAEFLDKSVEVLRRSTELIGNVRKLQKLREDVFQVRDVDVCSVLADIQSEYSAVSDKTIALNMNGHDHCIVQANELLHDVFSNLMNNAVKHTGDGTEITVDLNIIENYGKRFCRVAVEDNGPGIPDNSKGRIFNRMHKGTARGMGLGLYLVRTLVDDYNGRVWVEDRVQGDHTKGARFVVMLPAIKK
jgi:PAS domain S-box-containing protein